MKRGARARVVRAVFAAWLWPAAAVSADAPEPGLTLSLAEALERAERTVPELAVAEGAVREAEATRVGAGVRLPINPRVQLDGRRAFQALPDDRQGFAASADILFEVANAAGARIDEAGRRVAVASAELAVSRLEARMLAFRAYVAVELGDVRVAQARQALGIAERLEVVARERLSAGAGSEIETTSAEVELAESRAALHEAQALRDEADRDLRFLLALPADRPLTLSAPVDRPPPAPPTATLVELALRSRPDLRVTRDRVDLLSASETRLRREAQPRVGVFGGVDASPASAAFGIVGLSVELPIAQRNQGPRAVVAAARQTELARLDLQRRRTEHGVRAARALYESRRAELEILATQGIPAAERRLSLVEGGWRAGRFDVLRVTTAARDLGRLRERLGATLADIWRERILLERLIGTFPR